MKEFFVWEKEVVNRDHDVSKSVDRAHSDQLMAAERWLLGRQPRGKIFCEAKRQHSCFCLLLLHEGRFGEENCSDLGFCRCMHRACTGVFCATRNQSKATLGQGAETMTAAGEAATDCRERPAMWPCSALLNDCLFPPYLLFLFVQYSSRSDRQ